ncbi:MAG: hypothetical protein ACJ8E4_00585, partial [Sphingomicrobium sp.]
LPDEVPENGINLRTFYVETSRYFWSLVLVLTVSIMIFLVPTGANSNSLGGLVKQELLDAIVLVVAIVALSVRNIRIQQGAVVILVALTSWVYVGSARAFH